MEPPPRSKPPFAFLRADEKGTILAFRFVLFLVLTFLLLYNLDQQGAPYAKPFILLGLYLLTIVALCFVPAPKLLSPQMHAAIFSADVAFITVVIYLCSGWDSDLYLIYFLIIFMSGIQIKVWQSFLTGTVSSALYVWLETRGTDTADLLGSPFLLRIPFFYIISFSSALAADRVNAAELGLQERLRQSEKLNSLGMLATGIAHEINTPLTAILGFAQLMLENKEGLGERMTQYLENIVSQSERCRALTQDLLNFGRKREARREILPIDGLLDSALKFADYELVAAGVELVKDCPRPSPKISADPVHIQQIFINLIVNARHAMESADRKLLTIRVESRGGKIAILFQDSGRGIPAEHLADIFEPFFTTKPVGKGTGLGLSVCRQIAIEHGGTIAVASRPGEGATFTINLPAAG